MKSIYIFIIVAIFSLTIFAQNDNSELNFVRLSVFDDEGRNVSGLKPEHFILKEGKETKKISQLLFEENEPVAISILIDDSYFPVAAAKTALQFIQKANSANDYCIISFNQNTELLADWKSDDDKIVSSLNKIAGSKVKTKDFVPFDAVAFGLEKLEQSALKKKVLLIFGTSYDTKSKISFKNLKDAVKNSDSIIYAVKFYISHGYSVPARDEKFEKITEMSSGGLFDFYIDSGMQESFSRPEFGNAPPRYEVSPKPALMRQNLEKAISDFCDMLVLNVEKTYLIAYEQKAPSDGGKLEIKISIQDDKGKKIKSNTRVKKLLRN